MTNDVIDAITPADFRGYFLRDFRYLPVYSDTKTYFLNNIVYLESTDTFYKCIVPTSLAVSPVTPAQENWTAYDIGSDQYVYDADIEKAFDQADANMAPEVFDGDTDKTLQDAFMYLTAHYLCMDFQMMNDGVNSQGSAIMNSKAVGSVSISLAIPEAYLKNAQFGYLAQTMYGQKYLSYVLPRIVGRPGIAYGDTLP